MASESVARAADSSDRVVSAPVVSAPVVSAAPGRGRGPDPVVGEWS